jgi:hypothetical protein
MRRLLIAALLLIVATAVFATARQDTKPAMPMMHGMMMNGPMMSNSPMNIPGVEVAVEDTPNGVSVSFTTKTGDAAELRRLVRQHIDMMKNMQSGTMMHRNADSK